MQTTQESLFDEIASSIHEKNDLISLSRFMCSFRPNWAISWQIAVNFPLYVGLSQGIMCAMFYNNQENE